ncbi:hypothetical protein V8D89_008754 [Ganoderma adspersum]
MGDAIYFPRSSSPPSAPHGLRSSTDVSPSLMRVRATCMYFIMLHAAPPGRFTPFLSPTAPGAWYDSCAFMCILVFAFRGLGHGHMCRPSKFRSSPPFHTVIDHLAYGALSQPTPSKPSYALSVPPVQGSADVRRSSPDPSRSFRSTKSNVSPPSPSHRRRHSPISCDVCGQYVLYPCVILIHFAVGDTKSTSNRSCYIELAIVVVAYSIPFPQYTLYNTPRRAFVRAFCGRFSDLPSL